MKKNIPAQNLLSKIYYDPKYKGKHIIILDNKIYATKTGKAKSHLLDKLFKQSPNKTPIITYIPKADTLILINL